MENQINEIMKQVKSNKKYKTISDEIVLEEIMKYLKKNPDEKINKSMIKKIRKNLHGIYSSYQTKGKNKRIKLLEELRQNPEDLEIINKILLTSVSTKERLDDYENIYKNIFKITGKPNVIIDLGAGLNPVSFLHMNLKKLNYYAYDIDESDINFLNDYFNLMKSKGLNGKAQILNVRNMDNILKLPSSDIIFMFKLIDIIDIDNHKTSEEMIKFLISKTKFIIASFATKTITRKKMNFPKRKWFELMLERIGLKFESFSTDNEVFYIIEKR